MFFELWWNEENYCCLYTPIQMMNMIGILMEKVTLTDGIKFRGTNIIDKYKTVRHYDHLFPINE